MTSSRNYKKTFLQLRTNAAMLWPNELYRNATAKSIVPQLLETQDNFIGILKAGANTLDDLFTIINHSSIPNNLFVRHLMVLCDIGGENLSSYNDALKKLLPSLTLEFLWNGNKHRYVFKRIGTIDRLTNAALDVTASKLKQNRPYRWPVEENERSHLQKDVIVLMMFGSSSTDQNLAEKLQKCQIGEFLGQRKSHQLETFIRERYIWVSRQVGGSLSNTLGALAEETVVNYLNKRLREEIIEGIDVRQNGSIEGVYDNEAGNPVNTIFLSHERLSMLPLRSVFKKPPIVSLSENGDRLKRDTRLSTKAATN